MSKTLPRRKPTARGRAALQPRYMTSDQVADLVERTRANEIAATDRRLLAARRALVGVPHWREQRRRAQAAGV